MILLVCRVRSDVGCVSPSERKQAWCGFFFFFSLSPATDAQWWLAGASGGGGGGGGAETGWIDGTAAGPSPL